MLRTARLKQRTSLRSVAQKVAVDAAYLSRVESGKVPASRGLLASLARELELNEEQLLALGGFLPETWRDAVARRSFEVAPPVGYPRQTGAMPLAAVAEPLMSFPSRGTLTRLEALADPLAGLFPRGYLPAPEIKEIYELKLALLEAHQLDRQGILDRGAYFVAVDGEPTRHFVLCTGGGLELPRDSGSRLRSFLANHQFKTSYATHGLFPYRGKFHPQMIKALLNVMGIEPGMVVLDPMAGSGTTSVEAALMGVDSIAVDASPFCELLARTKVAALEVDLAPLRALLETPRALQRTHAALGTEEGMLRARDRTYQPRNMSRPAFDLLALAFLDARGYAERSARKSQDAFFGDVLRKYVTTVEKSQRAWRGLGAKLGTARVVRGDARSLEIADASVDGVLFSPPYSFAIDYLENDASHLRYLGHDPRELRTVMIGLNGRRRADQITAYFEDMEKVLAETSRVLKPEGRCTIIVGSNANQLSRAMGRSADSAEVRYGLEGRLIELAESAGLRVELAIRRLIVGLANSMREEHIVILRKGG